MSEMLDTFGVPEFFSTHLGALEDAGDGMMRVIRCIKRGGVLIPVVTVIMPGASILSDGPRFREMAREIMRGQMASH